VCSVPAVGASDAPLVDADSRFLGRWNTPLIIFFEAVAAATMTIAPAAANLTPTAERPDEPAEIHGERDGHRGDAGRSDAPNRKGKGSFHLSKVDEHATGLPGMPTASSASEKTVPVLRIIGAD
jgi:hypothetical protein